MTAPGNAQIAQLLAMEAERETDRQRQRSLRSASLAALSWREEAGAILAQGRSLTELWRVGPFIASKVEDWVARPPEIPPQPASRRGWIGLAEARRVIADHPEWRAAVGADLQAHTTATAS